MKNIILTGTNEGTFDYNRNVSFSDIKDIELQLQLHAEMVLKNDSDAIIIMLFTRYLQGNESLISYSVSLNFKVDHWSEIVNVMSDDEISKTDEVHRMLAITVGFLRGSLSLQLRSTLLKGAFLPLINIEYLVKDMNVNRWKTE